MNSAFTASRLRHDALAIWRAGVAAVQPAELMQQAVRAAGDVLTIAGRCYDLRQVDRIAIVGAGKAGAGMARSLLDVLGKHLVRSKRVFGIVNVLNEDADPTGPVVLHPGRPAGDPSPTLAGVAGSRRMLQIIRSLGSADMAICLLSGGGSALMPLPPDDVPLVDKRLTTALLSRAGADIRELNIVRKHLSNIKGGRLAQACRARHLISLIISDVIGNPLDIIASGPTVPDASTYADALHIVDSYLRPREIPRAVHRHLQRGATGAFPDCPRSNPRRVRHVIVGDNRIAVETAARKAQSLGYRVIGRGSALDGESRAAGEALAHAVADLASRRCGVATRRAVCLIGGGETRVTAVPPEARGGRNQELVLAALHASAAPFPPGVLILSAGTDGEDGPTDAAGALVDARVAARAVALNLSTRRALAAHSSYGFFDRSGGLLRTGPTGTNVMDIQLALIASAAAPPP